MGLTSKVNLDIAQNDAKKALEYLDKCLFFIGHFFLELLKDTKYICGEEMTLADISAFCEVT